MIRSSVFVIIHYYRQIKTVTQWFYAVFMDRIVLFHLREIQESELQKFHSRLAKTFQAKELGHEAIDSLQRLRLILFATKYTRK